MGRDVFDRLSGVWSIDRSIEPGGRFEGRAVFRPDGPDRLAYEEHGDMILADGNRFEATRRYVYDWIGDGIHGRIVVRFDDGPNRGNVFLSLDLQSADDAARPIEARDCHLCGKDVYDAVYRFVDANRFEFTCRVRGPRKDYVLRTAYNRMSAGDGAALDGAIRDRAVSD
jgi:hypothetical protein